MNEYIITKETGNYCLRKHEDADCEVIIAYTSLKSLVRNKKFAKAVKDKTGSKDIDITDLTFKEGEIVSRAIKNLN